jgi:hypothetical protein
MDKSVLGASTEGKVNAVVAFLSPNRVTPFRYEIPFTRLSWQTHPRPVEVDASRPKGLRAQEAK